MNTLTFTANRSVLILALACAALLLTTGCSSGDDLDAFIAATNKEPGGRVESLPEVKPYETYVYADQDRRSPFMPGGSGGASASALRPDVKRSREFLEQFSLDTLRMVGTLRLAESTYGLVQTKDGLVHRVQPGNYIGQADGRVTEVAPAKINVLEIVPDGLGGYMERSAALDLSE